MLWLPSTMRGIWDAAVPTLALPGPSLTEAEDGRGEHRGLPVQLGAAIPVPKHIPGEDPGWDQQPQSQSPGLFPAASLGGSACRC